MLYDISPLITPTLAVWPGDTPLSREVQLNMSKGDPVNLSTLRATVHLGAHADAPSHYDPAGADIASCDLERYLGPCQVVRIDGALGQRISTEMLPCEITQPRVLFATGTFPDRTIVNPDFAALEPDLVDFLSHAGVTLVGIDTPGVDPLDADLSAHHRFRANRMSILEGLQLDEVPEGQYELIALPLPLSGFDGSPVRAVLRS